MFGSTKRFVDERNHINGIENFWNQANEWRFNGGNHRTLLNQLKTWIKSQNHP